MRLNKFLSNSGLASRRKCDKLIEEGKVYVNGKAEYEFGRQINEKKDKVMVEGKLITLPSSFVYVKLNKPKGYACTANDERGRKTIYDLIDSEERLFSIGRLDYDTEGLILLTNDGDFANKVAHPKFHIEKEYRVTVEGEVKESELAVMRNGVVIDGQRLPKARVESLSFDGKYTKLSVIIDEGLNRQIRRMFEAIGKSIRLLKRVRIGDVKLGGLKRGDYRDLTENELNSLVRNVWK